MFHFGFDVDAAADDLAEPSSPHPEKVAYENGLSPRETFCEIDFESLLKALPTQLSYSFVPLPSFDDHTPDLNLARRDLFDVRFQLISEGTGVPDSATDESDPSATASALLFIDNPSDLVPLVYEGGLKTWECSLDLAGCLRRDGHAAGAKGRRVLELGCGTAIPTVSILREIFTSPLTEHAETHIHLQDYNATVLKLVTMPNIILAWYTSPAADAYRGSGGSECVDTDSEVHLTPRLLLAFKESLRAHQLHLRFFSGAWHTFDFSRTGGGPYDLVLTAETIYHPYALPGLVRLLRDACVGKEACVCLVAAKMVYFGVGGGIVEFVRAVEAVVHGGRVETVWETSVGVSRRVMRVWWM